MNTNHHSSSPIPVITVIVAEDLCKTPSHKPAFLRQAVSQQAVVCGKDSALLHPPKTQDNETPSVQCLQQFS